MKDFVPVFRCLFCSDIHIYNGYPAPVNRLSEMFRLAYRYADAHPVYRGLDAVVVVGDMTDHGSLTEMQRFREIVDAGIRREETRFLPVMGNHEYYDGGQKVYREVLNAEPDVSETVKGFHLIGLSPFDIQGTYTDGQIRWLEKQLAEAAADDPDKPIFTFQHHHLKNTVYASRHEYTNCTEALDGAFRKYPQILNFSGHSHAPVNNPISVWQEHYTLFGTGTLSYFEMETGMTGGTIPAGAGKAAQFYFVEVDRDNRVRVLPYNILTEDFFREPSGSGRQLVYEIDDRKDPASFRYTPERYRNASVPRFPDGAELTVSEIGPDGAKITVPQAADEDCVYSYRAVFRACPDADGNAVSEYRFFSEYYFEPMPETVSCRAAGLSGKQVYAVEVYPVNIWQQEGAPLTARFETE